MASPELADPYLQQVHSARTQLQVCFRRAHRILALREADLLKQLDDIQTSYEQEMKSREEEIQDLEKSKRFLKTSLHDNDTLNKALAPLTDKLEQILRLASATRTVRFQWNTAFDGDLQLAGEIITSSSVPPAVIPYYNLAPPIPHANLTPIIPQTSIPHLTPVIPQTSIPQPNLTPIIPQTSILQLTPVIPQTSISKPNLTTVIPQTSNPQPDLTPVIPQTIVSPPNLTPIIPQTSIHKPNLTSVFPQTSISQLNLAPFIFNANLTPSILQTSILPPNLAPFTFNANLTPSILQTSISQPHLTPIPNYRNMSIPIFSCNKKGTAPGQLRWPEGLAIEPQSGTIYIADCINNKVQAYTPVGFYLFKFSSHMDGPWNICINDNTVYVSQFNSHCVTLYTLNGEYLNKIGSEGTINGEFKHPRGIAVSATFEHIYVCDAGNNRVQIFNKSLNFHSQFGNNSLNQPTDIKLSNNCVIVLDASNPCIHIFSITDCSILISIISRGTQIGAQIGNSYYFTMDTELNFILTDCKNHCIKVFNITGDFITQIGRGGHDIGEFTYPAGIAIDRHNIIVVSNNENCSLQIF